MNETTRGMSAHTPGRLTLDGADWPLCLNADAHPGQVAIVQARELVGCGADHDAERARVDAEDYANAARLVACWNACEGIADPASLRAQRDELLAALRMCMDRLHVLIECDNEIAGAGADDVAAFTTARAAIARAEGSR